MVWTLCNVVEHEWPRGILRNSIITTLLTKICFIIDEFEINEIFICIKLVNCTTRRVVINHCSDIINYYYCA